MSRRRNPESLLLLACLCGLLAGGRAWALKTDKHQPIDIQSDHADFNSDPKVSGNGTAVYTGHVVITQGSIVLHADKAVLSIVNNDLSSADLTGDPATFVQQPDNGEPMHGESKEITYDAARNELTLITNAKLTQQVIPQLVRKAQDGSNATTAPGANTRPKPMPTPGERLMTADVIHYNTDSQQVIAKSVAGDEQQRVHMTFPPKTLAPAPGTVSGPGPAAGRKSLTVPPAKHAPTSFGAPPQAPAPASTPPPAAATEPRHTP